MSLTHDLCASLLFSKTKPVNNLIASIYITHPLLTTLSLYVRFLSLTMDVDSDKRSSSSFSFSSSPSCASEEEIEAAETLAHLALRHADDKCCTTAANNAIRHSPTPHTLIPPAVITSFFRFFQIQSPNKSKSNCYVHGFQFSLNG